MSKTSNRARIVDAPRRDTVEVPRSTLEHWLLEIEGIRDDLASSKGPRVSPAPRTRASPRTSP